MASLKEQILKQGQLDKEAFRSLSELVQEALIAEVTAVQNRIADSHFYGPSGLGCEGKDQKAA